MKISVSNYSEAHDQPRISKKLFHYSLPVQLRDETLKKKKGKRRFFIFLSYLFTHLKPGRAADQPELYSCKEVLNIGRLLVLLKAS